MCIRDRHTTNQSPLVQPQTVQPIQQPLQGLPSPAIHQQLQHQSSHIQNDSGPYLQPIPQSLHDPKVEQINNYEKEVLRILNSDINIHEKRALYQEAVSYTHLTLPTSDL